MEREPVMDIDLPDQDFMDQSNMHLLRNGTEPILIFNNFSKENSSEEAVKETDVCDPDCVWSFWIQGVIMPIISIPGIAGNVACVFVFNNKSVDLKPSFANLLKCLSIYDIIFLIGVSWLYTVPELFPSYTNNVGPYVIPFLLPLTQTALTGSVYCVIAVALERYFNICKPFDRNRPTNHNGIGYIVAIVFISIAYNVIKFFEVKTVHYEVIDPVTNISVPRVKAELTTMRLNPVYATVYIVCNTILMGIFPILILWFLNWRIIRAMKLATKRHNNISSLQRRDRAMTALLSGVVLVLILCHSPKTVINIYESYQMVLYGEMKFTPLWGSIVIKFSHLLLSISSALNIIIYSYKDFKFRAIVTSLFRGRSTQLHRIKQNGDTPSGVTDMTQLETLDDSRRMNILRQKAARQETINESDAEYITEYEKYNEGGHNTITTTL